MQTLDNVLNSTVHTRQTVQALQGDFTKLTLSLRSTVINISANQAASKLYGANLKSSTGVEFDSLQIIQRIGKGAFSEVFQAVDEHTEKEYALRLCTIDNHNFTFQRATKEINICNT